MVKEVLLMKQTFTITSDHAGRRLDTFLHESIPDLSRSRLQKLIKDGIVLLNRNKVTPHHFLKEGDVIVIPVFHSVIPAPAFAGVNSAGIQIKDDTFSPNIIAETSEYLILDKPAGMIVHPVTSHQPLTLVDWILTHYPEVKKIGDDPLRPGIVHRLDKDASGVMVVARTQDSFESLIRQFKLRQIKKEYLVLVAGRVTPTEGVIDFPIGRSKKDYTKRAAHTKEGRSAITRYEVLEQFKHAALVHVVPETGRTHQIRVHFFAKGNYIIGDTVYSPPFSSPRRRRSRPIQSDRLMLHATLLGFRDLSGEWQKYEVKPDKEFQRNIEQVRIA